jgi:hypothetical protein
MAFFSSTFLSYMDESHAFWAFCNLMKGKKYDRAQFYVSDLRLKELNRVWEVVLHREFSKAIQIDPNLYAHA